jgi:hypothetical protein
VLDGLVLAPCDRSAIWLGKAIATLAFLVPPSSSRSRLRALLRPLDATRRGRRARDVGICAVGTLLAAMAAASRAAS